LSGSKILMNLKNWIESQKITPFDLFQNMTSLLNKESNSDQSPKQVKFNKIEFSRILTNLGLTLNEGEWNRLFNLLDRNVDGQLDCTEFC
jgi:hypothetical protein